MLGVPGTRRSCVRVAPPLIVTDSPRSICTEPSTRASPLICGECLVVTAISWPWEQDAISVRIRANDVQKRRRELNWAMTCWVLQYLREAQGRALCRHAILSATENCGQKRLLSQTYATRPLALGEIPTFKRACHHVGQRPGADRWPQRRSIGYSYGGCGSLIDAKVNVEFAIKVGLNQVRFPLRHLKPRVQVHARSSALWKANPA